MRNRKKIVTQQVVVRCTLEERMAWKQAAKQDGRNLSDWIRRCAHQIAGTKDPRYEG